MRRRFFVSQMMGDRAFLTDDAAHHLARVLRAEKGQLYELSDGEKVRLARVERVTRDRVEFLLLEELPAERPRVETTLLLSIVKFDAFEWAIEKATELGVDHIVPLAAVRSDKALAAAAAKRALRWRKILLEASQQSRRLQVPSLDGVVKAAEAFARGGDGLRILLSERPGAAGLKRVLAAGVSEREPEGSGLAQPACQSAGRHAAPLQGRQKATLAIGPEGGWTEEEYDAARRSGFREASMGKLILRTETAVVASLAAIRYEAGD
jgi:16S rRNA (uracil1498-N3)-methyltransferase